MEAESGPAAELTEHQRPGAPRDSGWASGAIGRPKLRRHLKDERGGQQRAERREAADSQASSQKCRPSEDQHTGAPISRPMPREKDSKRSSEKCCRRGRQKRKPVARKREVREPGSVVHAGESRPRAGDAGRVGRGQQLPDLGQKLGNRESCRADGRVVQDGSRIRQRSAFTRIGGERKSTPIRAALSCKDKRARPRSRNILLPWTRLIDRLLLSLRATDGSPSPSWPSASS